MTRTTALLGAASAALLLAACSQEGATASASKAAEAGTAPASAAVASGPAAPAGYAVRPGYWKTVTDSGDGELEETLDCITPEDARVEAMRTPAAGLQQDGCTYTKSHFDGGRIDIAGSCNNDGVSGTTSMTGSYGGDRIDYVLDIKMNMGAEPIALKTHVKSRRIADACPAEAG
jgi:hypothetical protein